MCESSWPDRQSGGSPKALKHLTELSVLSFTGRAQYGEGCGVGNHLDGGDTVVGDIDRKTAMGRPPTETTAPARPSMRLSLGCFRPAGEYSSDGIYAADLPTQHRGSRTGSCGGRLDGDGIGP